MADESIRPFKIAIPGAELELLQKKVDLARLPTGNANAQWGESNGVTLGLMQQTLQYWRDSYDWRAEEAKINDALPQFQTEIAVPDFGVLNIHFVHSPSRNATADSVPLLFLHGWPGSFIEVSKVLAKWNDAGFHVVAPSLPGYGFSSYPDKEGYKISHTADVFHQLMLRLGYNTYAVQGGDWGSFVGRAIARQHPDSAKVLHVNMILIRPDPKFETEPQYTPFEVAGLERRKWFAESETAYQRMQATKPRTLGFAMHDSPVGMLAWMVDKLFAWTDAYPWTPAEMITWTLLHYFPGPTTGFLMYRENMLPSPQIAANPAPETVDKNQDKTKDKDFVHVPVGVSLCAKELGPIPRVWAETKNNIVFWRSHEKGGHFAAWEKPEELGNDVIEFVKTYWKS